MDNLIFDLVTNEGFWRVSPSEFEDKLKEYRDEIDIKIDNVEELNKYIEKWIKEHNFSNLKNTLHYYDLEKRYDITEAVYTIDGKYYRMFYYSDPYNGYELDEEPIEVIPIEKTVTITEYVEKG